MNTKSLTSSPATAGTTRFFPSSLRLAALTAALLLTSLTTGAQTTYTVTFDANEGTGTMAAQTFTEGTEQELTPNAYTFSPYNFDGWNTRADGTGTAYADKASITVTADMTLYAQWVGKIYTLIDHGNYYESNNNHDDDIIRKPKVRGSYFWVFEDYETPLSPRRRGSDTSNDIETLRLHERDVLTGTGGVKTHVVIADGATVTLRSANKKSNSDTDLPGIECEGDATIILCGDNYVTGGDDCAGIYVHKDKTLTIRGGGSLTATGGHGGGFPGIGSGEGQDCGSIIISKEVSRVTASGYPYCIGPRYGRSCGTVKLGDIETGPFRGNINTRSYTYDPNSKHTVTFDAGGGTGTMEAQTFAMGTYQALNPNAFEKKDKAFYCWISERGERYNDRDVITVFEDITLSAVWIDSWEVSVTFDANGGNGSMEAQKYLTGQRQSLTPNLFSRDGYYFTGWNTARDGSGDAYNNVASIITYDDMTLYAQWSEEYKVYFYANGGDGSMPIQVYQGLPQQLTKNTYYRDGYVFDGWNTASDGSGVSFIDEQSITVSYNLNLYAQWTEYKTTCSVIFNANGGYGEMDNQVFTIGDDDALHSCLFLHPPYIFAGWNTKSDGTGIRYAERERITLGDDLILYAQWARGHQTHEAATITIDSTTGDVELGYGDVLTGTGGSDTHVVIKAGAVVTLYNVTITGVTQEWAGITCKGNATIVLAGENNVKGGVNSSGIAVPKNKTLTIRGEGSLNATGSTDSPGIGGVKVTYTTNGYEFDDYDMPLAPSRRLPSKTITKRDCGHIVIESGTVTATGNGTAAGIGGAQSSICGSITIGPDITLVTATSGGSAPPIGKGPGGTCQSVNVDPDLMDEMSGSTRTICPEVYSLWLGGRQVNRHNRDNILGDGTANFDPATNTLTLNNPKKNFAIRSVGIDLTVEGRYQMTNAVDGVALDVKGGTLTMEGSFTLRGSVNGVEVDNAMSVKGQLRAAGIIWSGIRYVGTATDHKLTLVPGFIGSSRVELKGGTAALSYNDGSYFDFAQNGYTLDEPESGKIVVTLKGTATGDGTESDPYQINSADDWAKACEDLTYGFATAGKYFRIGSSFTAKDFLGLPSNPFAGVLDGGSEQYTVTADMDEEYVGTALFYSVSGATIRNLCVKGSVRGGNGSAGIVGEAVGGATTMENCVFSGTVSTTDGEPADNWIVGRKADAATVTTVNCLDASQHHWGTGVRAYRVTGGEGITPTLTGATGIVYEDVIWAPANADVEIVLPARNGGYRFSSGTLKSINNNTYTLMMPEEDVVILPYSGTYNSFAISFPGETAEGRVVANKSSAPAGTTIFVNVTPADYYLLDELTVTTDPGGGATGEPVEVDYDHCFRMPTSNVIVSATFKKKYSFDATTGVLHLLCGDFSGGGSKNSWDPSEVRVDIGGTSEVEANVTSVIADKGVRFVGHCHGLFQNFSICTSIDLSNVETSGMTEMTGMFADCSSLTTLNLTGVNTAQVTDMSHLFEYCSSLRELDLSGFNVLSVTNFDDMFQMSLSLNKLTLPTAFSITKEMALNKGSHDAHWNYSGWQLLGNKKVVSTVSDAVYDSNNNAFTYAQLPGQLTVPTFVWKEMPDDFVLELPDGQDNRDLIALWDGLTVNVKLTGRTLYKDGYWNTLCLPFTLSTALDASYPVLSGAEFKRLDVDGKYNGQGQEYFGGDEQNEADYTIQTGFDEATGALNLFFKDGDFEAGTPLLVKWDPGEDIVSPTFNKVTITKTLNDVNSGDGIVTFRGNYDYRSFPAADRSILFLGGDDKLYYPESGARIGPSRSYFKLVGVTVSDLPSSSIQMHFGGGDATGMEDQIVNSKSSTGKWFDLAGRRIDGVPTAPGIYIKDGKKIIVK